MTIKIKTYDELKDDLNTIAKSIPNWGANLDITETSQFSRFNVPTLTLLETLYQMVEQLKNAQNLQTARNEYLDVQLGSNRGFPRPEVNSVLVDDKTYLELFEARDEGNLGTFIKAKFLVSQLENVVAVGGLDNFEDVAIAGVPPKTYNIIIRNDGAIDTQTLADTFETFEIIGAKSFGSVFTLPSTENSQVYAFDYATSESIDFHIAKDGGLVSLANLENKVKEYIDAWEIGENISSFLLIKKLEEDDMLTGVLDMTITLRKTGETVWNQGIGLEYGKYAIGVAV